MFFLGKWGPGWSACQVEEEEATPPYLREAPRRRFSRTISLHGVERDIVWWISLLGIGYTYTRERPHKVLEKSLLAGASGARRREIMHLNGPETMS